MFVYCPGHVTRQSKVNDQNIWFGVVLSMLISEIMFVYYPGHVRKLPVTRVGRLFAVYSDHMHHLLLSDNGLSWSVFFKYYVIDPEHLPS